MHYKIFLCVLLFPVSLSAQNGELSLTLEQSASLMNKGSRTLQMADKAVDISPRTDLGPSADTDPAGSVVYEPGQQHRYGKITFGFPAVFP